MVIEEVGRGPDAKSGRRNDPNRVHPDPPDDSSRKICLSFVIIFAQLAQKWCLSPATQQMALLFASVCSYAVETDFPQNILYLMIGSLYFSAKLNENTAICFHEFQSRTSTCPVFAHLL